MVSLELAAALFIAGIAAGIALHRVIISIVLDCDPDTRCAYCKWSQKKKSRHDM